MSEMTIQTIETPYGNFKIPCSEGTTTDQLIQHVCTMMEKNGEEKRKTRQQTWDNVKTLAPVVIDYAFKSAVSAAADYYSKKQAADAEKEKQEDLDKLDLSSNNK
jgi:hypothetical protein